MMPSAGCRDCDASLCRPPCSLLDPIPQPTHPKTLQAWPSPRTASIGGVARGASRGLAGRAARWTWAGCWSPMPTGGGLTPATWRWPTCRSCPPPVSAAARACTGCFTAAAATRRCRCRRGCPARWVGPGGGMRVCGCVGVGVWWGGGRGGGAYMASWPALLACSARSQQGLWAEPSCRRVRARRAGKHLASYAEADAGGRRARGPHSVMLLDGP